MVLFTAKVKDERFLWKMVFVINEFVSKGSVGIKFNNEVGRFFQTKKWLRQRDMLSPLFFNLVADMIATLIARDKTEGPINCLVPYLVEWGRSIIPWFWIDKKYEATFMCFWIIIWPQNQFPQKWTFVLWKSKELGGPIHTTIWLWDGPLPYLGFQCTKKSSNTDWKMIEDKFEKKTK
jgi:hypothetical protein